MFKNVLKNIKVLLHGSLIILSKSIHNDDQESWL